MSFWKIGGFIKVNFWSELGLNYALQPTPLLMNPNCLRIYIGVRDFEGISRIMYVDVNPNNPTEVLGFSKSCVLDIGSPGMFDDNGVVPTIVRADLDGKILLNYAGYQIPKNTKFLAFGGLALSVDGGESFRRFSQVPVMDRTEGEEIFRVPHSMLFNDSRKVWQVWYGAGNSYRVHNQSLSPSYDIRYCESSDGIFFTKGKTVITFANQEETRVGRPFVSVREDGTFEMFFAKYELGKTFRLAYAESADGIEWIRQDDFIDFGLRPTGEDKDMASYPATFSINGVQYLLYNGNEYGKDGICWSYRLLDRETNLQIEIGPK